MNDARFDLDLDLNRVQLDGEWLSAEAITGRITEQVQAGNYRVARLSLALQALEEGLASVELVEVKLPKALLVPLNKMAEAEARPLSAVLRRAVSHYLGSEDAANRLFALTRPAPETATSPEADDDDLIEPAD